MDRGSPTDPAAPGSSDTSVTQLTHRKEEHEDMPNALDDNLCQVQNAHSALEQNCASNNGDPEEAGMEETGKIYGACGLASPNSHETEGSKTSSTQVMTTVSEVSKVIPAAMVTQTIPQMPQTMRHDQSVRPKVLPPLSHHSSAHHLLQSHYKLLQKFEQELEDINRNTERQRQERICEEERLQKSEEERIRLVQETFDLQKRQLESLELQFKGTEMSTGSGATRKFQRGGFKGFKMGNPQIRSEVVQSIRLNGIHFRVN